MSSLNKVILMGNLTRDPELKRLPQSGMAVTRLRLAINETYRDRSGGTKEAVCYVDVDTWDRSAESCAQYLTRGSSVLVEGRLIFNEWKTPGGETRSKLSVRADRVHFIGSKRTTDPTSSAGKTTDEPPLDDDNPLAADSDNIPPF